jgi:DNA-binding CsgD family transcriptional regulator
VLLEVCPVLSPSAGHTRETPAIDFGFGAWDDGAPMLALSKDRAPLQGRATEVEVLTGLLDDVDQRGAALVLRGDPGIGKSRLLSEAVALAGERQMNLLVASGVQSEARLAFGGLQQLLRPVRSAANGLPAAHKAVLEAALGVGDDEPPEPFRIALVVLDLLSDAAADSPLLLVAEDAHWLDRPSLDVLGFVARRIESDPIVLLASAREGYPTIFSTVDLPQLRLQPLDPESATRLLGESGDHLTEGERSRILREAAGNPLALVELPSIAHRLDDDQLMPGLVPLTERLERACAARAADLPRETQLLLLVAALNDSESLSEVLQTGRVVADQPVGVEDLQAAADSKIVELDERAVRFRHPLMRSAVRQSASVEQRRRVHAALAETLEADPDRRVWHQAALLIGVHEHVATELEEAGRRARRRGAVQVAFTALRGAAELSDPAQQGRRLLSAGELAVEVGKPELAAPLLREVGDDGGPVERARAMLIEELVSPTQLRDVARVTRIVDAAERAGAAGDRDLHIGLLWRAVSRAWWTDPGPDARRVLVDAARRLGDAGDTDSRVIAINAYADPVGHAADVLPRLEAVAARRTFDTESARHLGPAALVVGAFDVGMTFLTAAVDGLRGEGRLGHLPRMLALQGMVASFLATWDIAVPAGEEARRLASELDQPLWIAGGENVISMVAGMRGDADEAERGGARAERLGLAAGGQLPVALAQFGRVFGALGEGRHDDAYAYASRLFDPADTAYHPATACWLIADLAEAALHAGRSEEGRHRLAQVEAMVGAAPAVWIELNLRHARALLAADEGQAQRAFDDALAADLGRWPFQHARLLLAYGEWLRRQRRIADSRGPLRSARDTFDRLGCISWSGRARRELRASGESSRRRDPAARDELTAQELHIAQLAAQGLSNREIGQKLFVSPRTVSTHLYRIYPKLGISARGELASALGSTS